MEAQELRIGNYINGSIGDDSELVLCSVTGYDPRDEFIFVSNDNNIHYAEFVDFQPIPLTEEWLLRFGFIKLNNRHEFVHGENERNMSICCEDNYFLFFVEDEISYNTIRKELKLVHQLQNLFYCLCGIDLELNK